VTKSKPAPASVRHATITAALDDPELLGEAFAGASWDTWRAVLRGAYALPMTDREIELFKTVAEREPPTRQVRELVIIAGRRSGKDSIASAIAAHAAAFRDYLPLLRPGERATVACLACDRDQAKIVHNYTKAFFEKPMLRGLVEHETANGFELSTGAEITIATNSFRAVRGRTVALAIFDELAYWRDENSATPDKETYRAIMPGLATIPGAMLVMISSPYRKSGLLYEKFKKHFGKDVGDVLVIQAASSLLNPTLDQHIIDEAMEDDPAAASAEWLAQFRDDITNFIAREVVEAAVVTGRHELAPVPGISYVAFTDPSGGSSDSFTLAVAHRDINGRSILDAIRERKPPFSPESVVEEFCTLLKSYGISNVCGDRYAGEWPRERFREHGIDYLCAEKPKSDIYRDVLPLLNSGKCELLDSPRLIAQLCGLERRTARGGKDSIDHGPGAGAHDDAVNSALGSLWRLSAWNTQEISAVVPIIVSRGEVMKPGLSGPLSHYDPFAAIGGTTQWTL
jgi:hypothetical protein